jgi:hypothetical protein
MHVTIIYALIKYISSTKRNAANFENELLSDITNKRNSHCVALAHCVSHQVALYSKDNLRNFYSLRNNFNQWHRC